MNASRGGSSRRRSDRLSSQTTSNDAGSAITLPLTPRKRKVEVDDEELEEVVKFVNRVTSFLVSRTVKPWNVVHVDLIGPYSVEAKQFQPNGLVQEKDLQLTCMTMLDPDTGWFEIVEIPN
jgi:hypothetical protein